MKAAARKVVVLLMGIGPVYTVPVVAVGAEPLVVYRIVAPIVSVVIVRLNGVS